MQFSLSSAVEEQSPINGLISIGQSSSIIQQTKHDFLTLLKSVAKSFGCRFESCGFLAKRYASSMQLHTANIAGKKSQSFQLRDLRLFIDIQLAQLISHSLKNANERNFLLLLPLRFLWGWRKTGLHFCPLFPLQFNEKVGKRYKKICDVGVLCIQRLADPSGFVECMRRVRANKKSPLLMPHSSCNLFSQ